MTNTAPWDVHEVWTISKPVEIAKLTFIEDDIFIIKYKDGQVIKCKNLFMECTCDIGDFEIKCRTDEFRNRAQDILENMK